MSGVMCDVWDISVTMAQGDIRRLKELGSVYCWAYTRSCFPRQNWAGSSMDGGFSALLLISSLLLCCFSCFVMDSVSWQQDSPPVTGVTVVKALSVVRSRKCPEETLPTGNLGSVSAPGLALGNTIPFLG